MRKFTLLSLLMGSILVPVTAMAADEFMEDATLEYPYSSNVSMPPGSVDISWNNQEIELIDPYVNDNDEEVVDVYVKLGDAEPQSVSAAILYSFGFDGEDDFWYLEAALYELDDLYSFTGTQLTVIIPEGIVKNLKGQLNPAQEFVFNIVETYTDYTEEPASGSELVVPDAYVYITFEDATPEYVSDYISASVYEPAYKEVALYFGDEVTIKDGAVQINLNSLSSGDYEVLVPEAMFKFEIDGKTYYSPDIWLDYTVDAKSSVATINRIEKADGKVYNLKGMRVGDSNNIEGLKKGIYVIDGKKVIIK